MGDLDVTIMRAMYGRGDALAYVMAALSMIGGGWGLVAIVPWLAPARTRAFAAWLLATVGTQALLVFALKRAFGRTRPWIAMSLRPLLDAPTDNSFPSGHAAGSFTCAAFLLASAFAMTETDARKRLALLGAVALMLAFAIAASRVFLGAHYPSDVAAGALLGALVGWAGASLRTRLSSRS